MPVDLFLSHISEERALAVTLQQTVQDLFHQDVRIFTSSDVGSIVGGENWLSCVQGALERAQAVLVLCSRASIERPWVQFELGAAWVRNMTIIPVCHGGLQLSDLPVPLSLYHGVEIDPEGLTRLSLAIARLLGTPHPPTGETLARHLQVLKAAEKNLSRATLQFERFIDVVVPAPGRLPQRQLPEDTRVEADEETLKLFGFITGPRSWREIMQAAQRTRDQRWLKEVQACIYLASHDRRFRPVQAVYHNELGSFQPQLSRRDFLPGGDCRFRVHLVETVVAPLKDVDNEFGVIATVLRLGLRFRYEVLQKYRRALRSARRSPLAEQPALAAELLAQLRHAVQVIEIEASSRGAENIDRASVADLFVTACDEEMVADVQSEWDLAREQLFRDDPRPNLGAMLSIVDQMCDLNYRLMALGTRRYHEMVRDGWRPEPIRAPAALHGTC